MLLTQVVENKLFKALADLKFRHKQQIHINSRTSLKT